MAKTHIFCPRAGNISYVKSKCAPGNFLSLTAGGTDLLTQAIVTNVSFGLSGNYQFLHTIDNFLYLYAFGDRISIISVSGLSAVTPCFNARKIEIQKTYSYYLQNRVAKKTEPLDIVLQGEGGPSLQFKFKGYLTGATIDVKNTDPSGTVAPWQLKFEAVFEDSSSAPSGGVPAGPFGAGGGAFIPQA